MPRAYYNDNDRFVVAWLKNLITAGLIADGEVDDRPIQQVQPADLRGFTQCHFFAGIGGWSYALRLAGWPDDRPVWTGSCPCQPFSTAGYRRGFDDQRHLWPAWSRLITECRPSVVFGEQVASKDGEWWFDVVRTEMEAMEYAVGMGGLPAACVAAPEERHRAWFVAESQAERLPTAFTRLYGGTRQTEPSGSTAPQRLANSNGTLSEYGRLQRSWRLVQLEKDPLTGFWGGADWLRCDDGKVRPVEPGTFPLAHGVPARMGRLRAYGNAIVPQVAAEFIGAYMNVRQEGLS